MSSSIKWAAIVLRRNTGISSLIAASHRRLAAFRDNSLMPEFLAKPIAQIITVLQSYPYALLNPLEPL